MARTFEDFAKRYRTVGDDFLMEVVHAEPGTFEPEAVAAAEAEITRREITPARKADLIQEMIERREDEEERRDAPLPTGLRILVALLAVPPLFVFAIGIALVQRVHGPRRFMEAWLFLLLGFAIWFPVLALVAAIAGAFGGS